MHKPPKRVHSLHIYAYVRLQAPTFGKNVVNKLSVQEKGPRLLKDICKNV